MVWSDVLGARGGASERGWLGEVETVMMVGSGLSHAFWTWLSRAGLLSTCPSHTLDVRSRL